MDEDDFVSLSDLVQAATSMNVNASKEHLTAWFQFHNKSGSGLMTDGEWSAAIDSSATDEEAKRKAAEEAKRKAEEETKAAARAEIGLASSASDAELAQAQKLKAYISTENGRDMNAWLLHIGIEKRDISAVVLHFLKPEYEIKTLKEFVCPG